MQGTGVYSVVPVSSIKGRQHSLGNDNEASSSEGSAEGGEAWEERIQELQTQFPDTLSLVNGTRRTRSYYSACALDSFRSVGSGQCQLSTIMNVSIIPPDKMSLGAVIKVNSKGEHVVRGVKMDSPAEMAGLEQGDVLVALNNMPIHGLSEEEIRELTTLHEGSKLIVKFRHANETAIRTRIVFYKKSESGNTESIDIFTSLYNSIVYGHPNGVRYVHENFENENKFLYKREWEDGKTRRLRRKIYQIIGKLRYFPRIKAFAKWKDLTFDPDQYACDVLDKQHRLKVAERRNAFLVELKLLDRLPILTDIMTLGLGSKGKRSTHKANASESPAGKSLGAPVMALESLFSLLFPGADVNASGGEGKKRFTPLSPSLSPDDTAQFPQRYLGLPYIEERAQSRYNSSAFFKDHKAWVNKWQEALSNAKVNSSSTWTEPKKQDIIEARALVDERRRRKAEVQVILRDLGIDTHDSEVRAIRAQARKHREKALDLELHACALFDRRQRQDLSTLKAQLSSLEDAVPKPQVQDVTPNGS